MMLPSSRVPAMDHDCTALDLGQPLTGRPHWGRPRPPRAQQASMHIEKIMSHPSSHMNGS